MYPTSERGAKIIARLFIKLKTADPLNNAICLVHNKCDSQEKKLKFIPHMAIRRK